MKYIYNICDNKIVCVSHYAGKAVRGVSKCDETCDEFDIALGMDLAKLRCDKKIAEKRLARATAKFKEAQEALVAASNNMNRMNSYYEDSLKELYEVSYSLEQMEESIR